MGLTKSERNLLTTYLHQYNLANAEVTKIDADLVALLHRRNVIVNGLEQYLIGIEQITQKTRQQLFKEALMEAPPPLLNSNMTIGDAMATIISNEGPQFQKDLIEKITVAGIKISKKNPYNVIGNAIRTDKQRRFKTLEDGRVALRNENE